MPRLPIPIRTPTRQALNLAALLLVGGALTLAGCENDFSFTDPLNREICTDAVDNDSDGKTDCRDTECGDVCTPHLTLNPLPAVITADSLPMAGTHQRAASITVSLSPSGLGGQAQITGSAWAFTAKNLVSGTIGINLIAIDSTGLWRDTASANVTVQGP